MNPSAMKRDDLLITFGGAIKALEITETADGLKTAKVGGYLVSFTDPANKDLQEQFFDANTYYGAHKGNGMDVMIHHGIPLAPGLEKFAKAFLPPMEVTEDELGLFATVVLDLSDLYQEKVYDLVMQKALKWSSGSAPHMAEVDEETGYIKCWPIIEGSLTPTPVGTQVTQKVLPLKSYMESLTVATSKNKPVAGQPAIKSVYFSDWLEQDMTMSAISPLRWEIDSRMYDIAKDIRDNDLTLEEASAKILAMYTEAGQIASATFAALMAGSIEPVEPAVPAVEAPAATVEATPLTIDEPAVDDTAVKGMATAFLKRFKTKTIFLKAISGDAIKAGAILKKANVERVKAIVEHGQAMLDEHAANQDKEETATKGASPTTRRLPLKAATADDLIAKMDELLTALKEEEKVDKEEETEDTKEEEVDTTEEKTDTTKAADDEVDDEEDPEAVKAEEVDDEEEDPEAAIKAFSPDDLAQLLTEVN